MAIMLTSLVSTDARAEVNKLDLKNMKEWDFASVDYGGKLIFSDSPELVNNDGIMYRDTLTGKMRIFFHHVNNTQEDKHIVVILENNGPKPVTVAVTRHGLGGPDLDYLRAGKEAQAEYFDVAKPYKLEIRPNQSVQLIADLALTLVKPNMLVNGMYDLNTTGPVTVKTIMHSPGVDALKYAKKAKVLAPDKGEYRLRGTFEHSDRIIMPVGKYDPKYDGLMALTLADHVKDLYIKGIDATDGTKVTNYGNYGVIYRIFIPSQGEGKISGYLNPQGGVYAGVLGSKVDEEIINAIATPKDRLFYGVNKTTDYNLIDTYKAGTELEMFFSPPGASNLPIKIIIAPL